jgi:hypothetical protein
MTKHILGVAMSYYFVKFSHKSVQTRIFLKRLTLQADLYRIHPTE